VLHGEVANPGATAVSFSARMRTRGCRQEPKSAHRVQEARGVPRGAGVVVQAEGPQALSRATPGGRHDARAPEPLTLRRRPSRAGGSSCLQRHRGPLQFGAGAVSGVMAARRRRLGSGVGWHDGGVTHARSRSSPPPGWPRSAARIWSGSAARTPRRALCRARRPESGHLWCRRHLPAQPRVRARAPRVRGRLSGRRPPDMPQVGLLLSGGGRRVGSTKSAHTRR
jgi:hypothetical protein